METEGQWESKTPDEIEEWFLAALEEDPLPLGGIVTAIRHIADSGDRDRANDLAGLTRDVLAGGEDAGGMLELLEGWRRFREEDPTFLALCRDTMQKMLPTRKGQAFVRSCGFDDGVAVAECLRRLRLLLELAPGDYCCEKTWGFGVVSKVDEFYEKVTVDFSGKPGHKMSFSYAAEVLQIVGDEHLMVLATSRPETLQELLREDPAEVVRIALRSYGPMPVATLSEVLVGPVLEEKDWKPFWDGARKGLKADPLVDIPAKRSAPIRLLDREKDFGDAWCEPLSRERDPERILSAIRELDKRNGLDALSGAQVEVIGERLAFVVRASEGKRENLVAASVLIAERASGEGCERGEMEERIGGAAVVSRLWDTPTFVAAVSGLPAREGPALMDALSARDPQRTTEVLLSAFPSLPVGVLGHAMERLARGDAKERCAGKLSEAVQGRTAGGATIHWLCKNLELADEWHVSSRAELAACAVECLEHRASGEELRAQNQVRKLFEDPRWVEALLKPMQAEERQALILKIRDSHGWDAAGTRSAMARIIKIHPELADTLVAGDSAPAKAEGTRFTSWRSYRLREQQMRELIERTIPENSREIAQARSYGDLRENFEYQAAKDRQRLLLQRQKELERDLKSVRATDFSGFPSDRVGPGTSVVLRDPEGQETVYHVLGEWDMDQDLGAVSTQTRLGQLLRGRVPGDVVTLPGAVEEKEYTVESVTRLPPDILAWVRETPKSPAAVDRA